VKRGRPKRVKRPDPNRPSQHSSERIALLNEWLAHNEPIRLPYFSPQPEQSDRPSRKPYAPPSVAQRAQIKKRYRATRKRNEAALIAAVKEAAAKYKAIRKSQREEKRRLKLADQVNNDT